jgi:predicted Zn-dependent protease
MKYFRILFVSAIFSFTASYAQTPAPSAVLPAEALKLSIEGAEANYNLDYETARAKFEEIRKKFPQHPAGDLYVANIVWLEHLYKLRRLQTGLYQNESFYAGFEGSDEKSEQGDAVDANVDRTFRALMNSAKTKALTMVNANPNDPQAKYYLGSIYSILAAYEASTARKFFSALRNGSKGVDAHQKVLKLKPDYFEAYLSVGLYEYIVGNLPFPIKTLAAMGGIRGNRERGIQQLKSIIENHAANADDARVLLIGVYQNEHKPAEALPYLKEFTARYPRNYLFKLEQANVFVQLNKHGEAAKTYEALIAEAEAKAPAAKVIDLIRFQYAEMLAKNSQTEKSLEQYLAAAKEATAEPGLKTIALLRAGQNLDALNRRAEALAQYKLVLARPKVFDSHDQANKGLKQAFTIAAK